VLYVILFLEYTVWFYTLCCIWNTESVIYIVLYLEHTVLFYMQYCVWNILLGVICHIVFGIYCLVLYFVL